MEKIERSGAVQNFLDMLHVLGNIDFKKFPKLSNEERYTRVANMFRKLSADEKKECGYEYQNFLGRIKPEIPKKLVREISDIVMSLTETNPFQDFKDFSSIKDYLASEEGKANWSEEKLTFFLFHISTLGKKLSPEERKVVLTMLFHITNFKSCSWNERNIGLFARILKFLKGE